MRVTARTYYHDYATTVNNLHSELNKAMEQVSSGDRYENAAESPITYYAGKRIANQLTDTDAKLRVIKDVENRLYQQERGALSIQEDMREINTKTLNLLNATSSANNINATTFNQEFKERLGGIVNTLNSHYDNFFVYGGNDTATVPFTLDMNLGHSDPNTGDSNGDSISLTYHHKFPGKTNDEDTTNIKMTYQYKDDRYQMSYSVVDNEGNVIGDEDEAKDLILAAMREQGKMSTGYGNVNDKDTLMDTYTGGLNMITGISSEALLNLSDSDAKDRIFGDSTNVQEADDSLLNSAFALAAKAILTSENYITKYAQGNISETTASLTRLHKDLTEFIKNEDNLESRLSNTYRELGIKQQYLDVTEDRLIEKKTFLREEYSDKVEIDTYEAIIKMYSNQYAYNAAMKVGSNIMQSSLFDFVQ